MKALVLGSNGFVGGHVVERLLADGEPVRGFDRNPNPRAVSAKGFESVVGDFLDHGALLEALQGMDTVFHCISTTVPSTSNLDPLFDIRTNLEGTVQLLEAMQKCAVRRVVFLSSGGTVYGVPQQVPIPEDHPIAPLCSYGIVKHAIERYLDMERVVNGLCPVIVRAANPYGIGQGRLGVQGAVNTFLKRVLDEQEIVVWGDGSVSRDYFLVDELADFCVDAARSGHSGIYNVGSGVAVSINELIALIGRVSGRTPQVTYEAARRFDVPTNVLDISRAERDFGWSPRVGLEEGLRRCMDHLLHAPAG